ncbi:ExeM/NucH family extracellular endonuclease [Pseudaquabacterium rugosum]|uniref:ExeM/NucH family extracellular endonuclease n=1 Tax=Pseudaquabacterium rugosum TaxID=2984194 RepID=A0ABU9BKI0_9BURK
MTRPSTARSVPSRLRAPRLAPLLWALAQGAGAQVVISQVYGGNGNTWASDYVELFNRGSTAVDVSGWSVQYASATGTGAFAANGVTALAGTLAPGRYLLVKLATSTTGTALPAADASGSLNLSGSNGKVVLANTANGLACNGGSISCAAYAAQVVDLVGYGTANWAEGTAAPAASATSALLRAGNGCTDSGNNAADFSTGTPAPRNSLTAAAPCSGNEGGGGSVVTPLALTIPAIQGGSGASAYAGRLVRTEGVVTRLTNAGYFIQALVGDGDDATSDGLYVYTATAPTVAVGQLLRVTGTVTEFGSTPTGTVTELTSPSATLLGSGYSIAPTPLRLPLAGGLERVEGMLISLAGPLTVNQNYFQARYGQLTLSAGGRLETPTNRHRPGPQAQALAADNAARRIVLDDGSSLQNVQPTPFTGPTGALRGGDTVTGPIVGVVDWGPSTASATGIGDWRILPLDIGGLGYAITHPRPTTAPAAVGNVKLASFNVLNYFTTFTNGVTASGASGQTCVSGQSASASCRGASNAAEFERQQAKIVAAITAIDADAMGLMEIQNDTVSAQNLVAALNARAGAGTWAVAPGAAAGVFGSDAIKTTVIYKPARLSPVGASGVDGDGVHNRPPLAQTFALANGRRFTLVVNHFKSKGSCPATGDADAAGNTDSGDGQGCWNALRTAQAQRLRTWAAGLQAASGSADVVLLGDFNAYAQEDPIAALTGNGWVDPTPRFEAFGYSYVFDGAAGRLDHAIVSAAAAAKVGSLAHWHINADESLAHDYNLEFKQPACATCAPDPYAATVYRSSDHDPVVLGLNLYDAYLTASGASFAGTAGDDLITIGAGRRAVAGGAGRDQFALTADAAGGLTLADFTPGSDLLNLRAVLQALRVSAADPLASGHVACRASGTDAVISVDPDAAGPAAARSLALLKNVGCGSLGRGSFLF